MSNVFDKLIEKAKGTGKRIVLTEKSIELNKKVILTFDKVEERLLEGFSIEEKEQLFDYLLRLEKNLEKEGDL